MSSHDQAFYSVVSQLALSFDGAVLGVALAYAAVRSVLNFTSASSALRKIRNAPSVKVADLRSILDLDQNPDQSQPSDAKLVVVRGTVESKSAVVDGSWKNLKSGVLVSQETNDLAVAVQRTQTFVYEDWRGIIGWQSDVRALLSRFWRKKESVSLRTVPFILAEDGQFPISDFVVVNVDGSQHPMPLTTVYHNLQPVNVSPYPVLQALFGHNYPIGLVDEEKILPLGKEIIAVGLCSFKNGVPELKSCKDLPYFLSEKTKDQMVVDLASSAKIQFWSAVVLGSLSLGVLGYAVKRNWNRWKQWKQQRQQSSHAADSNAEHESQEEEDEGDVPDGQLCVICVMRRRRSAFIPCGHLVCCQPCSISVERDVAPKCPVCRQEIRTSVRIYDS